VPEAAITSLTQREKRKQEIRGRIVDAAVELFSKNGCDPVTVEEICEHADVARKTFYNYYPNKQELLNWLSDNLLLNETFNNLELAMERHKKTADRLSYYFDVVASNLSQASELERELILQSIYAISSNTEESGLKLARLNESFSHIFYEGQEQGDVTKEFSPEFLAEMTVGALNGITLNWVHNRSYPILDRIQDLSSSLKKYLVS
jgi:AcrR family transcriptional regulator